MLIHTRIYSKKTMHLLKCICHSLINNFRFYTPKKYDKLITVLDAVSFLIDETTSEVVLNIFDYYAAIYAFESLKMSDDDFLKYVSKSFSYVFKNYLKNETGNKIELEYATVNGQFKRSVKDRKDLNLILDFFLGKNVEKIYGKKRMNKVIGRSYDALTIQLLNSIDFEIANVEKNISNTLETHNMAINAELAKLNKEYEKKREDIVNKAMEITKNIISEKKTKLAELLSKKKEIIKKTKK